VRAAIAACQTPVAMTHGRGAHRARRRAAPARQRSWVRNRLGGAKKTLETRLRSRIQGFTNAEHVIDGSVSSEDPRYAAPRRAQGSYRRPAGRRAPVGERATRGGGPASPLRGIGSRAGHGAGWHRPDPRVRPFPGPARGPGRAGARAQAPLPLPRVRPHPEPGLQPADRRDVHRGHRAPATGRGLPRSPRGGTGPRSHDGGRLPAALRGGRHPGPDAGDGRRAPRCLGPTPQEGAGAGHHRRGRHDCAHRGRVQGGNSAMASSFRA
jgi:hypothetical protein